MQSRREPARGRLALAAAAGCVAALLSLVAAAANDVRSGDRFSFAITGARVLASPGRTFDPGVVVVRGGVVEAVGAEGKVAIPADARTYDAHGKVVHAALVDPYVPADRLAGRKPRGPSDEEEPSEERTPAAPRRPQGPANHPLASVRADERIVDSLVVADRVSDAYRRLGFAVVAAVPETGILRGRAAVVSLADGPLSGRVLEAQSGQVISLEPERFDFANFGRAGYPISKMGAVALVRQSLLDARWWQDAEAAYSKHPSGQARPRFVTANAALLPAARGTETVVFEASDVLSLLREFKIAREMKLRALYVGAGDEYRLRDQVASQKPDEGKRKIHCHSYVKDEILQMIRTAEEFGIKVQTFQHALDGYKIADEIAKHGAGASLFSDWWAYKFEVYDAIPYAGPLLHERGVVVSYNSDSDELARRLNAEAGKAVKYGGMQPAEALAFVTSNPAKQLGIFDRTGSLEPGKDADFVVWSGDPLGSSTMALETWIEGKKYFDRAADLARRSALDRERADLVAKAKKVLERGKQEGEKPAGAPAPPPQATRPPEQPEIPPTPRPAPPAPTPTPSRSRP